MIEVTDEPATATENRDESVLFLSRLTKMVREGNEKDAMRFIYEYLYELRMDKDFDLCDRILEDIDEKALSPTLLVAVLTITAPLKASLNHRATFYSRAKSAIEAVRGVEAAGQILIGLE